MPATTIGVFKVTRDATTQDPTIQTAGNSITVPSYGIPPNAPQSGTTFLIDTSDARMTQAVSAVDPGHSGKIGLWTQHTVANSTRSMVRWYELDPVGLTVLQTGTVKSSTLFDFNGAIAPDRVRRGTTKTFGNNMVLSFNTSSASTFVDIRMVSKRGANTVSPQVVVRTSLGPDIDFGCPSNGNVCRWGDYAAATPDPEAPTTGTSTGQVWLTSMWTQDGNTTGGTSGTSWRTWNWAAKP